MYGIPNCDTVKKARKWLAEHDIDCQFNDFREQGVDPALLQGWLDQFGWEKLVNRRGLTWRRLSDEERARVSADTVHALLMDNPAMIKRPLLKTGQGWLLGFSVAEYAQAFSC
jgi:Spx/MgsR family transcriptional regulator